MGSAVPCRLVVGGFDEVGRKRIRPGYTNCSAGTRVCYPSASCRLLHSSTRQVPVAQYRRLINSAPSTYCLSLIFLSFSSTYLYFYSPTKFPSLPSTQNKIYSPNGFLSLP
ncbi:hypothetical protein HOY80DRAFT_1009193 [Tuber brumale]|nr:hypothetical protein HOY80DRAFT_1009193 [Tuber brumale]